MRKAASKYLVFSVSPLPGYHKTAGLSSARPSLFLVFFNLSIQTHTASFYAISYITLKTFLIAILNCYILMYFVMIILICTFLYICYVNIYVCRDGVKYTRSNTNTNTGS